MEQTCKTDLKGFSASPLPVSSLPFFSDVYNSPIE